MNKLIISMLAVIVLLGSCSKDDDEKGGGGGSNEKLVIPEMAEMAVSATSSFTGALNVLPCMEDTSIYVGNYNNRDAVTSLNAFYTIGAGSIVQSIRPVKLPLGDYNILYWGVPKNTPTDSVYGAVAINDPSLRIGTDLAQSYYSLRKRTNLDTLYYPVYDYVYAVNPIEIGVGKLQATLQRAVAGVKIALQNRGGAKMDASIALANINVGSIANRLNYYTAVPDDFSKTITFPLAMATDSMVMSANSTVMMFPSGNSPLLTIQLTLKNGKVKKFQRPLASPLTAGNRLNLTVTLGDLFSEESSSDGFEVVNWTESSETINFPDN